MLEAIAKQGKEAFYSGPIARAIIDAIHHDGGEMTLDDLASFAQDSRYVCDAIWRVQREYHAAAQQWRHCASRIVLSMLETRPSRSAQRDREGAQLGGLRASGDGMPETRVRGSRALAGRRGLCGRAD